MTIKTIYRLRIDPKEAVNFLEEKQQLIIANYIAFKFGTTPPTNTPPEWIPPQPCQSHDQETEEATKDTNRYIVVDRFSRLKMIEIVEKETAIAILRHEPPALFPGSCRIDMISVRAGNSIFHILMQTKPEEVEKSIKALKEATTNSEIFGRDCGTITKFLKEEFNWSPIIHDITPCAKRNVENNTASMNDIARLAFGGRICFNSSVFSAHTTPSTDALDHRDQVISAIFLFAQRFYGDIIPTQQQQPTEDWDQELEDARPPTAAASTPSLRRWVEPESRLRSPIRTTKRTVSRRDPSHTDDDRRKVQRREEIRDFYEPMTEHPPRDEVRSASHSRTRAPTPRDDQQQPPTSRASSTSTTTGIERRQRHSPSPPRHRRGRSRSRDRGANRDHNRGRDSERRSAAHTDGRREERTTTSRRHRPISREDARC